MDLYFILLIILLIITICLLIFFSSYTKLKKYNEKMQKAENVIDEELNKKLDLIIAINSEVKKVTGKKDYLKEYVSIRDLIITNIEKDLKLDEACKLINDLVNDFEELQKDEEFIKNIRKLKEIDEVLISAKNMFNQSAINNNQLIKSFPNNIVAKIAKYRMRSFFNINTFNNQNKSELEEI